MLAMTDGWTVGFGFLRPPNRNIGLKGEEGGRYQETNGVSYYVDDSFGVDGTYVEDWRAAASRVASHYSTGSIHCCCPGW
jgi:hypothetical protein